MQVDTVIRVSGDDDPAWHLISHRAARGDRVLVLSPETYDAMNLGDVDVMRQVMGISG